VRHAAALLFLLLATSAAEAGEMRELDHGGRTRSFYLHASAALPPGAPLVFALHGAGGNGRVAVEQYGWQAKADTERFAVVGPDASPAFADRPPAFATNPRAWNDGTGRGSPHIQSSDDAGFIVALINRLAAELRLDRTRVYVAGFSSGGSMTARLGQELPTRIAAIAPSASAMADLGRPKARAMPVHYLSGDLDPLNPVEAGEVRLPWGGSMMRESHRTQIDRWRRLADCPPTLTAPPPAPNARLEIAGPCRDGAEVRYLLIEGFGHHWPGRPRGGLPEHLVGPWSATLDGTDAIWRFFSRFRAPAAP